MSQNNQFRSDALFLSMKISPADVKRVQGVVQFRIFQKRRGQGDPHVWTLDLKTETGVTQGETITPDVVFTTNDENAVQIITNQQPIYQAFFRDKIQIDGDYQYAVKFPTSVYPKRAKL